MVCVFSGTAIAGNKSINGKYSCKGTGTQSVSIGGIGGGSQSAKIKGQMKASRGTFLAAVTTKGWGVMIDGYLEPDMQKVSFSSANKTYKTMTRGCSVSSLSMKGSGSQNKNGKTVRLTVEQSYYCGTSDALNVDTYQLTCKR